MLTGGGPLSGMVAARLGDFDGGVGARVEALRVEAERAIGGMPGGEASEVGDAPRGDSGEMMIRGTSVITMGLVGEPVIVELESEDVVEAHLLVRGEGGRGSIVGSAGFSGSGTRFSEALGTCVWDS